MEAQASSPVEFMGPAPAYALHRGTVPAPRTRVIVRLHLLRLRRLHPCLICFALLLTARTGLRGQERTAEDYFERYVRPVLAERCYTCHSATSPSPQGGLRVDSRSALLRGGNGGPAIVPGDPRSSLMVGFLRGASGIVMPPTGELTETQIGHFESWIRMGAPFPEGASGPAADAGGRSHWSFVPPLRIDPPGSPGGRALGPIDRFVQASLAEAGLSPSSEADPRTLLRRVHYDLTGLPPAPDVSDEFARSPTPQAYEEIVDALLESEHFGERWARHWLDVVRYSDEGFQARPFAMGWPYRDWVIAAFNEDLPYDDFIRMQLAADLIGGERRHLAALGMLTIGINLPRPTDVPENIDDRIDVVTRGFLGLSVACARCHDHKFDPIPTSDYYSLYSVFLNSPGVLEPVPLEEYGKDSQTSFFLEKLAVRRAWLDRFREERLAEHIGEFRKPETLARYLAAAWESRGMANREFEALAKERNLNHYLLDRWRTYLTGLIGPSVEAFRELDSPGGVDRVANRMAEADSLYRWPDPLKEAFRLALRGTGTPTDIPVDDFWWIQNEGDSNVMKGLKWQYDAALHDWSYRNGPKHAMVVRDAPKRQPAYVFVRGNQHDKGAEVQPRFLSAIPSSVEFRSGTGRLELAHAIASGDNPLTARVWVNRIWGHLFGEGIVRTPSDFGTRGDSPSNPGLLDYLASEFIAGGWSVKKLIRQMVLSSTYRQASADSPQGAMVDPDNRLLWRQNRMRLDFEALRDSMLAVAGRLDRSVGGPPFDLKAVPSSPRRSVYAYVSREEPSALMRTFDFSNPEEHTPRRQLTTVPQQALFLMNSPFLAEQARAVAASCAGDPEPVNCIHRRVLGRLPRSEALAEARQFIAVAGGSEMESEVEMAGTLAWQHGTAKLDPDAGSVVDFRPMRYRLEDRLQQVPAVAAPGVGRASLTASGGHPGDSKESSVVRRWTAPRALKVSVLGKLNHPMGDQALRFGHSNGIRGWVVSSRRGVLAQWTVEGFEVDTSIHNLRVAAGEHLDFVVDARGDYESDVFRWSPEINEVLDAAQRASGMEPMSWSAEEGFPGSVERPLTPTEQYAQVLLMTNEFAFRE